jgi:cysteine sulfinate desulfinase/cysteine desulfurase-like protein
VLVPAILYKDEINNVVRFTFGENTREEIDIVIEEIKKAINLLRKLK